MSRARKIWDGAITAELSRAARGLLDWTQQRASSEMGIGTGTLAEFEAHESVPRFTTLSRIESTYVDAGVTFVNDGHRAGALLDRARIIKKNET